MKCDGFLALVRARADLCVHQAEPEFIPLHRFALLINRRRGSLLMVILLFATID